MIAGVVEHPKVAGGGTTDAAWAAGPRFLLASFHAGERVRFAAGVVATVLRHVDGNTIVSVDGGFERAMQSCSAVIKEPEPQPQPMALSSDEQATAQTRLVAAIYEHRASADANARTLRYVICESGRLSPLIGGTLAAVAFDDATWHALANLRQRVVLERDHPEIASVIAEVVSEEVNK